MENEKNNQNTTPVTGEQNDFSASELNLRETVTAETELKTEDFMKTESETETETEKTMNPPEPGKKNLFKTIDGWTGWKGWARDVLSALILAGLLLIFIKPTVVQQHSMENTLYTGHYLILSRQAYRFGEPERGDIVVFKSDLTTSEGRPQPLIKRVIGLPGETISITGGVVYIDGEPLDEPYTKDGYTASEMEPYTIPEGYIFCMGDNRQNSMDSRSASVGPVPIENVIGKAVLRLWPLGQMRLYEDLSY